MSRSLGTLTLDLVAKTAGFTQGMDKASRESKKWRKQVERDMEQLGKSAGLAVAAVAGSVAAMTVQTVAAAKEINRFAQISGATAVEFQRMAAGADVVGISQEKLSDQLKDFNEKVGEFMQSGGGGMRDFFEQIAPKIGITKEAFKGLSGPQGLQLYYNSLEKAGLNQQQMSFYLESMASDTTALIPLLRDGGEGFKFMGDQAEQSGAVMSGSVLDSASRLSATMTALELSAKGAKNSFMEGFLPALEDLSGAMSVNAGTAAIAADAGETFGNVLKGVASVGLGAYAAIDLLGKTLGGLGAIMAEADLDISDAVVPVKGIYKVAKAALKDRKDITDIVLADLDETAIRYGEIINNLWDDATPTGKNNVVDRIKEIQDAMQGVTATKSPTVSVSTTTTGDDGADMRLAAIEAENAQREEMENARLEFLRRIRAEEEAQLSAESAVLDSLRTEQEEIAASYEERAEIILASTRMTEEEKTRIIMELAQQRDEQLAQIERDRMSATLTAYQGLFDGIAGLSEAFAGKQSGIYRAMFGISKAFAIADATLKVTQAIANASASGPFPANIAAMASVASATGGLLAQIQGTQLSFEGGGFTGYGPRSGGIDGKGGFPAIVHPNETIIDHTKGQQAGSSIRVVNVLDPSVVGDYLGTDAGEELIMNVVSRNRGSM